MNNVRTRSTSLVVLVPLKIKQCIGPAGDRQEILKQLLTRFCFTPKEKTPITVSRLSNGSWNRGIQTVALGQRKYVC